MRTSLYQLTTTFATLCSLPLNTRHFHNIIMYTKKDSMVRIGQSPYYYKIFILKVKYGPHRAVTTLSIVCSVPYCHYCTKYKYQVMSPESRSKRSSNLIPLIGNLIAFVTRRFPCYVSWVFHKIIKRDHTNWKSSCIFDLLRGWLQPFRLSWSWHWNRGNRKTNLQSKGFRIMLVA